jgi:hypothetical protein
LQTAGLPETNYKFLRHLLRARGDAFGLDTTLQTGKSSVRFSINNTSSYTTVLGSTQHLAEINTRDISWGKGGRYVGLTNLPLSCDDGLEMWEPLPPGTLKACLGIALPLTAPI